MFAMILTLGRAWRFAWRLHRNDPHVNHFEAEHALAAFYGQWIRAVGVLGLAAALLLLWEAM